MAKAICINPATLSEYENGHVSIPARVLKEIAFELDVSADWLLGFRDTYAPARLDGHLVHRYMTTREKREHE